MDLDNLGWLQVEKKLNTSLVVGHSYSFNNNIVLTSVTNHKPAVPISFHRTVSEVIDSGDLHYAMNAKPVFICHPIFMWVLVMVYREFFYPLSHLSGPWTYS